MVLLDLAHRNKMSSERVEETRQIFSTQLYKEVDEGIISEPWDNRETSGGSTPQFQLRPLVVGS